MALWLNKQLVIITVSLLSVVTAYSQTGVETPVYKDYKDPERFEKFRKRSIIVGAWQINMLKEEGAIVVKLKTNKLLIDQLIKQGKTELALEKQLEQFAINRNTMFAFKENFTFCKLYFIYSQSSDSLLNGAREGIFLDTNLVVDPAIVMTEKFYLVAEKDFAYSSSIGFVREDSARYVKEEGNPIKLMAIVLKNKYGHQLKNPMPYAIKESNFTTTNYYFPIKYKAAGNKASSVYFPISRTYFEDLKTNPGQRVSLKKEDGFILTTVKLKKEMTYEKLSVAVSQLNDGLRQVYQNYPKPDIGRVKGDIKPFLY